MLNNWQQCNFTITEMMRNNSYKNYALIPNPNMN